MMKKENKKNKTKLKPLKEQKDKGTKDYKIYGVRREEDLNILGDRVLPRPLETMLEKGGGCVMISASPSSGKSNLISNWYLRDDFFKDLFQGGLFLISPTAQNDLTSQHFVKYCDMVETNYSEALVEGIFDMLMEVPKEEKQLSSLVLDDCMGALKINTFMSKFSSTVRHLRNLLVFSTQACKSLPPNIRSNTSHSVVFHQPSTKQLNDLIELHAFMGGEDLWTQMYEEATAKKYGFLLNDFRDMKVYKWGGDLPEPIEIWSKYDDNGNINKQMNLGEGGDKVKPIPDQK